MPSGVTLFAGDTSSMFTFTSAESIDGRERERHRDVRQRIGDRHADDQSVGVGVEDSAGVAERRSADHAEGTPAIGTATLTSVARPGGVTVSSGRAISMSPKCRSTSWCLEERRARTSRSPRNRDRPLRRHHSWPRRQLGHGPVSWSHRDAWPERADAVVAVAESHERQRRRIVHRHRDAVGGRAVGRPCRGALEQQHRRGDGAGSVTVAAGATSRTFTVTTQTVASSTTSTITGTLGTTSRPRR